MALESGGYAEKIGNRYEASWIAYQLLRLLDEKITSVIVEPVGSDEVGTDVIVENRDSSAEHHQCKSSSGDRETWTISLLAEKGILANAYEQISRGNKEFHVVSPLPSKQLSDLRDSALNSPEDVKDFYKEQICSSKARKAHFEELCKRLNLNTEEDVDLEKARLVLRSLIIKPYQIDKFTVELLHDYANRLYLGKPILLVDYLKHYADNENKLRVKITTQMLVEDLSKAGFEKKLTVDDSRISTTIANVNKNFKQSITPFLISNTLITRQEITETIDSIKEFPVTLVTAEAGMGKSAFLLELHNKLESKQHVILSLRLDRQKLEQNADIMGQSLGFPYSPVQALSEYAGGQRIVLILDQLDAIRWTAAHSDEALNICQDLVRQIVELRRQNIDISLVFASRDFDIIEDVALNSWVKMMDDRELVNTVKLTKLSEGDISRFVTPYENFSELTEAKQNTLSIPLWLSIYLSIAQSSGTAPNFANKLELVKSFWDDRITVASKSVTEQQITNALDEVLRLMTVQSKLSIAESSVINIPANALKILTSVGILTIQNKQISFRHQALFDYQVGYNLFNAALESPEKLLEQIGSFNKQTLTKREHLKYALNMLLAEGQKIFFNSIKTLLECDSIRFHLKYLTFNALKEVTDLKAPAKKFVDSILLLEQHRPYFLSISAYGNQAIIEYLINNGTLTQWLEGSNQEIQRKAAKLLSSVAEKIPEKVIQAVQRIVGASGDSNRLAFSALCWNLEDDSNEMFELRKKLLRLGCSTNFVDWRKLPKRSPERALDLIVMLLEHYQPVLGKPRYYVDDKIRQLSNRDKFSESDMEGAELIADHIPKEALKRLLANISQIISELDEDQDENTWLRRDGYTHYDTAESISHYVIKIIENAAGNLQNDPDALNDIIKPYLKTTSLILNHLLAKVLIQLPVSKADYVIDWIMAESEVRLNCGNTYAEPKWILPGKLIEKFSPHCSNTLFEQLELTIYGYFPKGSIEDYKWRLENRRAGVYYSYWGELQHFLIPKLAENRISSASDQLKNVLERKFSEYKERDFCHAFNHRGGVVRSPLPTGNLLSNKTWRKLILAPLARTNSRTWRQSSKNSVCESSVEQFARSLSSAIENEPARFAQFALTLPKTIEKEYMTWIYYGLSSTDTSKVTEKYKDNWQPCPVELIEQVIKHFGIEGFDYQIVRIYEKRIAEAGWSLDSLDNLINLALNSTDPKIERLNVRDASKTEDPSLADPQQLASDAINTTRGIAYRGIGRLFWDSEEKANKLLYLVDVAISDPHPAVNYSAMELLLPLFNYNRKLAHRKFLELCTKDIRMSCARGSHYFFNDSFSENCQFTEHYIQLVRNMKQSQFSDVATEAGRQLVARWFFFELFSEDIKDLSSSTKEIKDGATTVINQFLRENIHNDRILKILPLYELLANDTDKDILRKIGNSVSNEEYWNRLEIKDFFSILASSKAAIFSLWQIFHYLDERCERILDISDDILTLIRNVLNSKLVDQEQRDMNLREGDLIKVLQRLHEEATSDEDEEALVQCLNIWDELLQAEVYSAITATNKIDNGLL